MPEGFSGVADLKVIVDANADKFHGGVQGVMGLLDGLGEKGNSQLGGLDKVMAAVGTTALGVSGKVKMLTAGVEAGIAVYQQLAKEGRAVAETLGVTAEYDRLKATIDDLGMSLQDGVIQAFFSVQAAGTDAASAMFGFSSATNVGNESAKSFAATLLDGVASALDNVRLQLRLYTADTATSSTEVDKTIGLLNQRRARLQEEIATLRAVEEQVEKTGRTWQTYGNDKILAQREAELNSLLERGNELLSIRANLPNIDWIDGTTTHISLLGEEIEALERRNATLGMSAAAAAEYNAVQKAIGDAMRKNIALTEDELRIIHQEAAIIGALTQVQENHQKAQREAEREKQLAAQRERSQDQVFANAEREIANSRARAAAFGLEAGAAAELSMQQRLLQQLRASGNAVTEVELVKINALASEYGNLTQQLADQQSQLRAFGEFGQEIAGGLGQAFAQWTRGTEINVKSMVASVLADLAQLALRRNVLEPLFGGGGMGGGGGSGLFGDALSSIFGGFRENGGSVQAGKAYVVGEKRPELFIPDQNGRIAPNVPGGGQPVQIVTNIDARGASTDAVAQIRSEMARRDAELPGVIAAVTQDLNARGLG